MNQEKLKMFYKEEVTFRLNSLYDEIFELLECESDFYKKKWLEQLDLLFKEICKKQKQGGMEKGRGYPCGRYSPLQNGRTRSGNHVWMENCQSR